MKKAADSFPEPLHGFDDHEFVFKCRCGTLYSEPKRCEKCERFAEPADSASLESWRTGGIGVVLDDAIPSLGIALMAAISCRCDCRRRRVMLRVARLELERLTFEMREENIGPTATEEQTLTAEEREAFFEFSNDAKGEYADYLRFEPVEAAPVDTVAVVNVPIVNAPPTKRSLGRYGATKPKTKTPTNPGNDSIHISEE